MTPTSLLPRISFLTLIGLSFSGVASAQVVVPSSPGNTTANWLQDWTGGTGVEGAFAQLPQSGDGTVIINQSRIIQVDSVISTVSAPLVIQNTNGGPLPTAFLEINTGGSITIEKVTVSQNTDAGMLTVNGGTLNIGTGGLVVKENGTVNVTSGDLKSETALALEGGAMNVNGGTVTLTDPAPGGGTFNVMSGSTTGALNVISGDFIVAGATTATDTILLRGEINLSGGNFTILGGQVFGNAASETTFNILGDASNIQIERFNNAVASRQTVFNFIFDETGVSSIEDGAGSYVSLASTSVHIDASAYTGGPATFELFDFVNVAAICPDVTFTGLGAEGVDYTFTQSVDDNNFTLEILTERGTPYLGWAGGFPELTDSDPELDFDGDGLSTGLEYVLGGNPGAEDVSLSPFVTYTGSTLDFDFRRSDLANEDMGTTIEVEYGNDLVGWTTAQAGVDDVVIIATDDFYGTGIDRVVVNLPTSLTTEGRMYARLKVTFAP